MFLIIVQALAALTIALPVRGDEITITRPALRSVRFVDDLNGWIAGHAGVFRTRDGGESWERQANVGSLPKVISRAAAEETGLIAWADQLGAIVRYNDTMIFAGEGFKEKKVVKAASNVLEQLYSVTFADRERGWAVGNAGIYRTRDGGENWSLARATSSRLTTILPVSPTEVWAVGEGTTVLHSTDGGATWSSRKLYAGQSQYGGTADFLAVHFINPRQGWIAGTDGLIFYTGDGGKTWQRQDTMYSRFTGLSAISFVDDSEGWVVGSRYFESKYQAVVLHTTDGGLHWKSLLEGVEAKLLDVQALSKGRAWIVGTCGTALRTEDHGVTWLSVKL